MTRTINDGIEVASAEAGAYRIAVTPEHQAASGITTSASTGYKAEIRITLADGSVSTQAKGVISVLGSNFTPEPA